MWDNLSGGNLKKKTSFTVWNCLETAAYESELGDYGEIFLVKITEVNCAQFPVSSM